MTDVAIAAGVSIKTVSRVINRQPNVRDDVTKRVQAAIATLNYHPNAFARGLVRQRSHLIGLVYENPSPSYVVELQRGVLHRLEGEDYRMVVVPVRSIATYAREIVGVLRSAALDGVVLAPPAGDHPLILQELAEAGIVCARIAPTRYVDRAPAVLIDDVAAARAIAAHLLTIGHRAIGIVQGDPSHASSKARMIGYRQAFAAAGVALAPGMIEAGMYTRDSGHAAASRLFARAGPLTAILAQNDDMAVGAMMAARERGIAVPDALSIAGFDDSEVSRITWPRLTTVRQPIFEMAVSATAMVIAQLEGEPFDVRCTHHHELLVRESTVPPSRSANR